MTYKVYILVFDPAKSDSSALHTVISESSLVHDWSHYLASAYLIASTSSLENLKKEIQTKWPKQRYFLARITAENEGWWPEKAWDWLRKYE